ncbi:MAG: O-antigen ligase family protein [Clostridia bacterium]|nr:O-antigen ligase family protein [Clostridia bacterium]
MTFIQKAQNFINSLSFVYAVALAVALIWLIGWEIAGFFMLVAFACTTLLLQRNATPFVVITSLVTYCLSLKQVPASIETGRVPADFVWLAVALMVLFAYMIFCVVYHKKKYPRQNNKFLNLGTSFAFCLVALALAGLFSDQFSFGNNAIVVVLYALLFVIYLVLSSGDIPDYKKLIAHIIVAVGLVISFEVIVTIANCPDPITYVARKMWVVGWGGPNNVATTMCFCIMMAFYLCLSNENPLYLVLAACFVVIELLTVSRGNIYSLFLIMPFVGVYGFVKTKRKKAMALTLLAIVAVVALFVYTNQSLIDKLFEVMREKGLENTPRRALWGYFVDLFNNNKLFGAGFFDPVSSTMYKPHAILVHILSGMGIFGLLVFGYHYYRKYIILLSHGSAFRFFAVMVCYQLFMYSVIDMDFYMIYQNFLVLGVLEALKQEREELGKTTPILHVPVWANVVICLLGIALAIVGTVFVSDAIVWEEGLGWCLWEIDYIITFACYVVGGVALFISWGNLWRNNLKPVVKPKLKQLLAKIFGNKQTNK